MRNLILCFAPALKNVQSDHPADATMLAFYYCAVGLRIDQIFRYCICIDTKSSIFDISFDILCKVRKIVVRVIITNITIELLVVYIDLLCNFHTVYSF